MFLLIVGSIWIFALVSAISPEIGWYLRVGWQFHDVEPSDTALFVTRVIGIFSVITVPVLALPWLLPW